tara:strand:- start:2482 stop:2874 length:393 start_codon:yes stop_codon:yes gene_type:complete
MSQDDSILILQIKFNNQYIYLIFHVKAHENFNQKEYILYFLSNKKYLVFTHSYDQAKQWANTILKEKTVKLSEIGLGAPEYGILFCGTEKIDDDYPFILHDDVDLKEFASLTDCTVIFNKKHPHPWLKSK